MTTIKNIAASAYATSASALFSLQNNTLLHTHQARWRQRQ